MKIKCIYSFNDDDNDYDKINDAIKCCHVLLLSDWSRGARWAWRRWNRGEDKSDKKSVQLRCILFRGRFAKYSRLVANLLRTCWRLSRLRRSYGETGV